jgi:multicomponent Na+:H+ antiporter subunit F
VTIAIAVALALVVGSAIAGLVRIALAPDDATRAVVADLLFFCAIAIYVLAALLRDTAVLFDVTLIATLTGILTTIALARMLTRGHR